MATISELLARAAALRDETAINSIDPNRAGGIMYDTLVCLNTLWVASGSSLVISKIYASVAAMQADTAPVSDLTGKALRPGQIVVIASSDADNGSVYRYDGPSSWSAVGKIGNLPVIDSLDSDSATTPLAAHQGKVLDGKISQLGQELGATNLHIDGTIDEGTIYNELNPSFSRVCAFYPIADVDAEYTIKISDIALATGNSYTVAIRSAATPYGASEVQVILRESTSTADREIPVTISDANKANAKFIAITSNVANSSASFTIALKRNHSIQEQIDSIDDSLDSIDDSLQELGDKDVELEGKIVAIDGIIDDGTTYNTADSTNRVCAYYKIPDVDSTYKIKVTNIVLSGTGNKVQLAIRSGATPYDATYLIYIGNRYYTQDTNEITFTIPANIKATAKYIGVTSFTAYESASFKVALYDLSADIPHLQEQIDDINADIEEIKEGKQYVDKIPYNDSIFAGGRLIRIYNPYKDGGNNQYTGQTHCHSWSYVKSGGVTYKVPIGYTVEQIAAMTEEQRAAAVESVNQQFVAAHKTVGYDFMTITNYDTFADYTPKPQVFPENFLWLCNGFEGNTGGWDSTGQAEDQGAHIVILNTDFGKIFKDYTPSDVVKYCEERNAVAAYAHPFLSMLYSSPEYVKEIKSGLRFIEVFNSLGVYHADVGGVPYIKPGIELDEDFDALLSQGNYTFCLAVSDQRNLGTTAVERNHLKEGCIKVFANSLAIKEIWSALLSGNFYASENVDVELASISLVDNVLTINVGVAGMTVEFVKEDNTVVSTMVTTSEQMSASYTISGNEKFIRARIYQLVGTDKTKRIWTQPIFIAPRIID